MGIPGVFRVLRGLRVDFRGCVLQGRLGGVLEDYQQVTGAFKGFQGVP